MNCNRKNNGVSILDSLNADIESLEKNEILSVAEPMIATDYPTNPNGTSWFRVISSNDKEIQYIEYWADRVVIVLSEELQEKVISLLYSLAPLYSNMNHKTFQTN